jgi:transaldolase
VSRLQDLHSEQGQSPWIDNLQRGWFTDGELARWLARGIRGMTSNPSTFQKAIAGGGAYDEQFGELMAEGRSVVDAYWEMVIRDVTDALELLGPLYESSGGSDGFVSLELAPEMAHQTEASRVAALEFHERIARPNLMVKIPGTEAGLPAVRDTLAAGRSVNITLLFSIERYGQVIDAYLDGLEACDGDLARVHSVASFFLSRVDTEVDKRLEAIGSEAALALRGRAAVAQAKLAYALFRDRFSGPRWEALEARGARLQRPLWASTSTKNPDYPDTLYVDPLIGPDTVNTMPEETLEAFDDHGTVARTVDEGVDEARAHLDALAEIGVDLDEVARVLEDEGVQKFADAYDELIETLTKRAAELG